MEKNIVIDGREYHLVTNGATPRLYRSLFRREVFTEMTHAMEEKGDGFEVINAEVFENLAFTMAIQGGSLPMATKIEDWLGSMSSPTAIIQVAGEILELWTEETDTTSVGKKE